MEGPGNTTINNAAYSKPQEEEETPHSDIFQGQLSGERFRAIGPPVYIYWILLT